MARAARLDLRLFQKELATRLASKTSAQVESSRLGLACAGGHWLIRLADASEVIAVPPIAPVPHTKPWFTGVANIRGNLYSIVDFARFIGSDVVASQAAVGQSRLVVFGPRAGDLRAGIVVQRVLGLRNVSELAPIGADDAPRAWFGQRWMDASGSAWQEIDLARLALDPVFLQAGI
ncbi:MAG: chemotaxis protein CheW [Pseudomonadota bacterium]|nr:chemotaxis protein CheW [Pseudomonadota bacterium]